MKYEFKRNLITNHNYTSIDAGTIEVLCDLMELETRQIGGSDGLYEFANLPSKDDYVNGLDDLYNHKKINSLFVGNKKPPLKEFKKCCMELWNDVVEHVSYQCDRLIEDAEFAISEFNDWKEENETES